MNDINNLGQSEYMQNKRQSSQHAAESQEQRLNQELRSLPEGKALFDWIARNVEERMNHPVVWQYADSNAATQNMSNRIHLMDGRTHDVIRTIEVDRQEIAQVRSMGQSWIEQLMFAINDEQSQEHQSQMHERFEQDMSDRFEEMMGKIQGEDG